MKIIIEMDESYCVKFYSFMKFIMLMIPMKITTKYKKVKQAKHYTKIIMDECAFKPLKYKSIKGKGGVK